MWMCGRSGVGGQTTMQPTTNEQNELSAQSKGNYGLICTLCQSIVTKYSYRTYVPTDQQPSRAITNWHDMDLLEMHIVGLSSHRIPNTVCQLLFLSYKIRCNKRKFDLALVLVLLLLLLLCFFPPLSVRAKRSPFFPGATQ